MHPSSFQKKKEPMTSHFLTPNGKTPQVKRIKQPMVVLLSRRETFRKTKGSACLLA
jgi:hypothetical protein